jgi:hypothetical protein
MEEGNYVYVKKVPIQVERTKQEELDMVAFGNVVNATLLDSTAS